jgi:hypothetical protein
VAARAPAWRSLSSGSRSNADAGSQRSSSCGFVVNADAGSRVLSRDGSLGLGPRRRQPVQPASQLRFCCPSPTSRATPPVGTGPADGCGPRSRDAVSRHPLAFVDVPRIQPASITDVGGRGPAVSSRPRRSALPARHPSILLRTASRETSACVPAMTTAFSGSRAPSVHLLGRASTSTPPPCAVTTAVEEPASPAACAPAPARSGSPSALGLVRLSLFPDHTSTRRDGWRERRSRGGGPEGRGTQGGTASGCGVHRVSPDAGTEQDPWVATRRADRRGETRAPGPVRRRSCSPPRR